MERIFYSKVDKSYYVMIGAMAMIMIYFLWIKMVVIALLFMLITWWLIQALTHMRYVVTTDNVLRIEVGKPFPPRIIPLPSILSVRFCKAGWGDPSLSNGLSLCICYEAGQKTETVVISPVNSEEFIRVLQKRNPKIQLVS